MSRRHFKTVAYQAIIENVHDGRNQIERRHVERLLGGVRRRVGK